MKVKYGEKVSKYIQYSRDKMKVLLNILLITVSPVYYEKDSNAKMAVNLGHKNVKYKMACEASPLDSM